MTAVYAYIDYRAFMREKIRSSEGAWGSITRLAEAAECQRSHLSRVLSEKVQITLEQGNGLAEFWQLNETETDYFLTLVELSRAGTVPLRTRLTRKIRRVQREQEDLSKRMQLPSISDIEKESVYYSAWYYSAIHIAVSIPELQTVEALSEKLALPKSVVMQTLAQLEQWSFVTRKKDRWVFSSQAIHLPNASPLIGTHHANWRARGVLDSQILVNEGVHFTSVQSVSRADVEKVKQIFIHALEEYKKVAAPSKEEELICVNFDVFKL